MNYVSDMDLSGKAALVTGGGRGIGAAIARRLAQLGAKVAVSGRSAAHVERVAADIRGLALVADLADRAATDNMLAQLRDAAGAVSILVNNAGIAESRTLADTDDATWDRMLEVNATAAFRLCRALVPAMVDAGWGRVINVASNAGVTGYAYTAAYCASKHAMVGLTRGLAMDVATAGVTVNAVCPGWVETDMAARAIDNIAGKTGRGADWAQKTLAGMSPQRRLMQPDEVAHAVAMLCADEARGIHGQTVVLDGGALMT